jgi:phosphoribosylanthranilate isomerase
MSSTPHLPPFVVKVCGITSKEDAHMALAAGANALGFNFYRQSPRYIAPESAQRIVRSLPPSLLKVGVFVNASEADLLAVRSLVPLDIFQLHGPALPTSLVSFARVWRAISPGQQSTDARFEACLIDTPSAGFGGSGRSFDWTLAAGFPHRTIIAGGLDARNVSDAIRVAQPWGVDACSCLESKPGIKDPERVTAFVQAALAAFTAYQEIAT